MPIKVYITIDTEEDQWGKLISEGATVENIKILPRLQEIFDRFGAIPTYLINYPVAINIVAKKILLDIYKEGRCAIGTHCHPWNTPPFTEELSNYNSMLCNLPYNLVFDKINILNQTIRDNWNISPICFRAGRWGFGNYVAKAIRDLDYKIDSSIAPFTDWSLYDGPDCSNINKFKYRFNPDNVFEENKEGVLLEVSPSVGFLQKNFNLCSEIRNKILNSRLSRLKMIGLLEKLKLVNYRWLSPEMFNGEGLIKLAKSILKNNIEFLNMSFHSTSLIPGLGPFVRSESDLARFMKGIELFLQFSFNKGFHFMSIDKAIEP